jgi:hypothetical protein
MLHPILHVAAQAVATTDGKNEHWPSTYWLVLGVPLAFYMACSLLLNAFGHSDQKNPVRYFFDSISNALERMTGIAGWAMAGILTGLLFLLVAAIGLYWDVSWHVDFGRDIGTLFTPPHVTILFGLGGLIFASVISIAFATAQEAPTKLRFGNLRVPYGGLLLGVMGLAAIAAFPLDNLWHWAYGLDVTLWSPTHLQLVTGGSMGTFAVVLLLAEALPFSKPKPFGRFWMVVACGALLTATTTYLGEFDFRVPQFNPIYLPILTMAAAGFALVFARIALGKWGAVKAVVAFLIIRTVVSGLVASLHHEFAMFPLYLPSALAIEAAAWWIGTENRLKFGLAAGALVGTVGLIGESIWYSVSGWFPAGPNSAQLILPTILLATPAAIAAAVLGAGFGKAFRKGTSGSMPVGALVAAGAVLLAALFVPLPRNVGNVQTNIKLTPSADGKTGTVTVQVTPADAANKAIFFGIASWQGGGTRRVLLNETSPGVYTESTPIPIAGKWKSMVALVKGSWNMAAPIYLPADPFIHAPEIPAVPERDVAMVRNTKLLLREAHGGPAWPSQLGWTGLALSVALLVGLIAYSASKIDNDNDDSSYRPYDSGHPEPVYSSSRNGSANGNGSWKPQPATVPAARWNPGGLTRS